MTDFSGQLPAPTNGVESSQPLGPSQGLPIQEQAQQGLPQGIPVPGAYGAPGVVYPPAQYVPPQLAAQAESLRQFWNGQMQEIHQVGTDPAEFKNHQLPLARIKKIMKSDEDVRMISAEAPVLFARACEMFILELTLRSWSHSEENKRRTLQRNDIAAAITRTDIFDFLVDIVPREERGDDTAAARPQASPQMPGAPAGMSYWQQPMLSGAPGSEQLLGARPPMQMDPAMMQFYMQQPPWQQPPGLPGNLPGIPQSADTQQQPTQQQPQQQQQQPSFQQQQQSQQNPQEPALKPK